MPTRAANGVLRTDPIETPIEQRAVATVEEEDPWHDWNAWMSGHKNLLRTEIIEIVAQAIGILDRNIGERVSTRGDDLKSKYSS